MSNVILVSPTKENIKTNILKDILDNINLHKNSDKEIFKLLRNKMIKLENTDFDLTKETFTFDEVEYGVLTREE